MDQPERTAEEEIADLRAQLSTLTQEIERLKARIGTDPLSGYYLSLAPPLVDVIDGLQRQVMSLTADLTATTFDLAQAQQENAKLTAERDAKDQEIAQLRALTTWQPIATCPKGYDGKRFHYVLFRGTSRGKSFGGYAYVSGYMSSEREPVHSYGYKLDITDWREIDPPLPHAAPREETPTPARKEPTDESYRADRRG